MSLLDDVSIVVTPNGYKAGELYAVIPVPTEGAEEVTNGDFATDSDWTKGTGWTISGGAANASATTATLVHIGSLGTVANVRYLISMDVTVISGTVRVRNSSGWVETEISSSNTYNYYAILGSSSSLVIEGISSFTGSINSISIKEYTSADMDVTRATAGTRVDENGLVNYAEVIGSELASPLNFLSTWLEASVDSKTYNTFTVGGSGRGMYFMLPENKTLKINVSGVTGSVELRYRTITGGAGTVLGDFDTDLYLTTTNATTNIYLRATGAGTVSVTDVSVKEVTRDNVPRIDYTGGGCPHILAEPQRTNLVTYSSDFSNAVWGNASIGTTPVLTSGFTSPDGTDNAYKISNANQDSFLYISGITASTDSRSIYARTVSGTGTAQLLSHNSNTNNTFNLTEEWQRFEVSATTSGTGTISYYAVDFRGSGTLTELLIWGAQTEVGSYPTSYIPTSGSTVTRNQDIFTRDGIGSLINSTEGVLFVEMAALSNDLTYREISLSDGTSTNRVEIRYGTSSNSIQAIIRNGSYVILQHNLSTIVDSNKVAFKWKTGDFALWINGVEVATDTTAFVTSGLNRLAFDQGTTGNTFFGKVKQLQVYNTALTDAQLTSLTS